MRTTAGPPNRLSDLIELAIKDARELDRSVYQPDASRWHEPTFRNRGCRVCLGGSVIARTLRVTKETKIKTVQQLQPTEWQYALRALDDARFGSWKSAHGWINLTTPITGKLSDRMCRIERPEHIDFSGWDDFDAHLASLADRATRLRKLGL